MFVGVKKKTVSNISYYLGGQVLMAEEARCRHSNLLIDIFKTCLHQELRTTTIGKLWGLSQKWNFKKNVLITIYYLISIETDFKNDMHLFS